MYINLGEVLLYDFFTMSALCKRHMRFRSAIVLCSQLQLSHLPTWACVGVGTEAASHMDNIVVLQLSWSQVLENFPCPKSIPRTELFGTLALMFSSPPFWKSPS